jgi:hypothetical protein
MWMSGMPGDDSQVRSKRRFRAEGETEKCRQYDQARDCNPAE